MPETVSHHRLMDDGTHPALPLVTPQDELDGKGSEAKPDRIGRFLGNKPRTPKGRGLPCWASGLPFARAPGVQAPRDPATAGTRTHQPCSGDRGCGATRETAARGGFTVHLRPKMVVTSSPINSHDSHPDPGPSPDDGGMSRAAASAAASVASLGHWAPNQNRVVGSLELGLAHTGVQLLSHFSPPWALEGFR